MILPAIQSSPSNSPSPLAAQLGCTNHLLCRNDCIPILSLICARGSATTLASLRRLALRSLVLLLGVERSLAYTTEPSLSSSHLLCVRDALWAERWLAPRALGWIGDDGFQ